VGSLFARGVSDGEIWVSQGGKRQAKSKCWWGKIAAQRRALADAAA